MHLRILTPAEVRAERARLDNILVVDPSLHGAASDLYAVSCYRDVLMAGWKPEVFDPRRDVGGGESDARHSVYR